MDEKIKILKMVEDGKITSDDASKLLEAIESKSNEPKGKTKWLKVKIIEGGIQKLNVKIPLSVIKIAAKVGGKFCINLPDEAKEKLNEKGINLENIKDIEQFNKILSELEKETPFELVNIDDGGKKVFVYIE